MYLRYSCEMYCALQGCQLSTTGVWGLGTLDRSTMTATYMPDGSWALTVLYSNPEQDRRFTVYYTLESPGSAPLFQYVNEITFADIVSAQRMNNNATFAPPTMC